MRSTADELALLRRMAVVARHVLDAERAFVRSREMSRESSKEELFVLRNLKHQLRRLLDEYEEQTGRIVRGNSHRTSCP